MENTIQCPNCHTEINVNEVLSHQLKEQFELKYLEDKKRLENSFVIKEEQIRNSAINDAKKSFELDQAKKMKSLEEEIIMVKIQLGEAEAKGKEAAWTVWQQDKKTLLGLVEKERSLKESSLKKAEEDREKLEEMVEAAKKNATNRYLSQREQGESFELNAAELIGREFPDDHIQEVKVGKKGTDLILHVREGNLEAGTISVECKNPSSKNSWTTWVKKTRNDMSNEGSKLALIVSTVPFENGLVTDGGQVFGSHSSEAIGVLTLLRKAVIEIAKAEIAAENSDIKAKALADFFKSSKWDNMLVETLKILTEVLGKVKSIKNAADAIHKNTEYVKNNFVLNMKNAIELSFLEESLKVA